MKKRDISLTTEAHRPAFNDFADALRAAESNEGWRSSEALRHFLDAGFRAVRGGTLAPGGGAWEKNEAEYMAIVKRCRKPTETMTALSRMLAALATALLAEPVDFVGPVFAELSADAGMGQFFTPHHLSYFMAKMIVGDAVAALGDRPYLTLCEPACGVGGMVLATNVALREAGLDVARQAHWQMTDVDHRAMCGAYLQAALTDTSAIVACGNSLSLETWLTSATPAAVLFPKTFAPRVDPTPTPLPPIEPPSQLTLF